MLKKYYIIMQQAAIEKKAFVAIMLIKIWI